jgi:hypothetical protein
MWFDKAEKRVEANFHADTLEADTCAAATENSKQTRLQGVRSTRWRGTTRSNDWVKVAKKAFSFPQSFRKLGAEIGDLAMAQ